MRLRIHVLLQPLMVTYVFMKFVYITHASAQESYQDQPYTTSTREYKCGELSI